MKERGVSLVSEIGGKWVIAHVETQQIYSISSHMYKLGVIIYLRKMIHQWSFLNIRVFKEYSN